MSIKDLAALFWRGEKPQWYGLKYGKIFTEKHIKLSLKCPQLVQGTVQKCAAVQWHTGQRLVHALPQFRWWLVAEAGLYHNQNSQNRTNLRLQTTLSWTPIMPWKGWPQKCIVKCRDLAVNLLMKSCCDYRSLGTSDWLWQNNRRHHIIIWYANSIFKTVYCFYVSLHFCMHTKMKTLDNFSKFFLRWCGPFLMLLFNCEYR